MFKLLSKALLVCVTGISLVQADLLPDPGNLSISGDTMTWDSVDGATGYNIYLGYGYFDTVKGSTSYVLTQAGTYWVVAFDDEGNYGSQYGRDNVVEYDNSASGDQISVTYNYVSSVVQTTCSNVAPGESCIASCNATRTHLEPERFSKYMSGGACSTSDIVEADAFVSFRSYKCTVPTFSGEVVAQAICIH